MTLVGRTLHARAAGQVDDPVQVPEDGVDVVGHQHDRHPTRADLGDEAGHG